ncbi:MAG: hypothetical protein PF485_14970 [Bacteroidales bacterium]|jgi:hypothetical protein|nr:hypothetical protein [Bacteroidales bacterium]
MFKNILIPFILFFFSFSIYAQDWNEIYYLEGDAQYLIEEHEYEKAINIYKKMLREIPEFSLAKYKIGLLYLKTDDKKNLAITFLEDASKDIEIDFNEKSARETKAPPSVLLYLGEAYQIDNQIEKAITNYTKFKELISVDNELYTTVIQRLKTCNNAKTAINKPVNASFKNTGTPINNKNSNFSATLSGDGQTMIFTSYTSNYIDVYSSQKKNNIWSTPKKITNNVSSKYYLKTSSLSFDGTQLYLVTDDASENEIFVSTKEGNSWSNAQKLKKTINGRKSNETHASVSKAGNSLYFTSDREGGYGGLDIYKSTLDTKGKWGEAENLGPAVNTEFDEETPFVTMNDKYLFFSSQGHSSIGGFDIFYIDLDSKTQVINLGYPANTTGDDLFFFPDNSLTAGYISQFYNTSLGKNDIYYISILPTINFAGNIKNEASDEIITDSRFDISIINSESNENIETLNTNNGRFNFEISPGNYTLVINNEGYDSFTKQINIPENYSENKYSFEALLVPVKIEEEILIAEVIEEVVTPKQEEIFPEEKVVTPPVIKEKAIDTPVEEKKPTEIIKEEIPEKEIVKYVPKESSGTGVKTFSVQLMALKNPVKVDYFKDVDNVLLTKYPDGFYRYTVGNTSSYSEAKNIMLKIQELGYKNAFIRTNESGAKYTVQIMALIIPVKPEHFENLSSVAVTKGSDDYFRYTIGSFNTFKEAKDELNTLKSLGYSQAFIKTK